MYRIFLVEDDFSLAEAMEKQLSAYGYEVVCARDFFNITALFTEVKPQLVLLDIMLPHRDGYFWCGEIRKLSPVPIVFISSASENMNIVMAVNMGGDDFIKKPVDPMVLTAKVSAILRRTYEMKEGNELVEFHGAFLDLSNGRVTYRDDTGELTKNEFRILRTLLENKGKIVSRNALMLKLWQDDLYVEENTLTVNVGRLRKKLEGLGLRDIISTKHGDGYIIE